MSVNKRFLSQIKKEIKSEVETTINKIVSNSALLGYNTAVDETVVDTGRMRSAWRLTKDQKSSLRLVPCALCLMPFNKPNVPSFHYSTMPILSGAK